MSWLQFTLSWSGLNLEREERDGLQKSEKEVGSKCKSEAANMKHTSEEKNESTPALESSLRHFSCLQYQMDYQSNSSLRIHLGRVSVWWLLEQHAGESESEVGLNWNKVKLTHVLFATSQSLHVTNKCFTNQTWAAPACVDIFDHKSQLLKHA